MRLEFFHVAERAAPSLLDGFPPFGADGVKGPPHLLIVGLGEMGGSVLALAALRWHAASTATQLQVTVLDRAAEQNITALYRRYPMLEQMCDIAAVELDVEQAELRNLSLPEGRPAVTMAYVCLGADATAFGAALSLHGAAALKEAPIIVRTKQHAHLAALLDARVQESTLGRIRAFDVVEHVFDPESLLAGPYELIARQVHARYVELRASDGSPGSRPSMMPWASLSPSLRESNRQYAEHIATKLALANCTIVRFTDWSRPPVSLTAVEIEMMAELEHARWCEERRGNGWTLAGAADVVRKQSPWLIPWDELPEKMRERDRELVRELPDLLARVGFTIARKGS